MITLNTEDGQILLTTRMCLIHDHFALAKTIKGLCGHSVSMFDDCDRCEPRDIREYWLERSAFKPLCFVPNCQDPECRRAHENA